MIVIDGDEIEFLNEGFLFGFWSYIKPSKLNPSRAIHINYDGNSLCKQEFDSRMNFYSVGITLQTFATNYDNICRRCIMTYNYDPPVLSDLKLRLGI